MQARPDDELVFLPLGGSGEVGMNLNAYGYGPPDDRKWIVVDVGVTFGDLTTPGVDIITPDASFLQEHAADILGIIVTHAHEDHIGGLPWLWPLLKAPIYTTPFTAFLVREKLHNAGVQGFKIHEVPLGGRIDLGPFQIDLITLTHSIPEPNGLAIRTPHGIVLHTGDWKIDPDPITGEVTDADALRRLGDEGVLAMVCDSTNVFVEGHTGSERLVRETLTDLLPKLTGRVAVACFASNVARIDSAVRAAASANRRVCLVGRSMLRMTAAAKTVGLLKDVQFIRDDEAKLFPENEVLYLVTGSQGEPRAALSRIADKSHPHVRFGDGDSVIFSSREIPGNEVGIAAMQNALAENGVRILTERDHPGIHVSGHPAREELRQMYQWARPRIAVPTHGERRHLMEHVLLAKELQVPEAIAPHNGDLIRLAPGRAEVIDEVKAGRLYVDGGVLTPANGEALRERIHAGNNGVLIVTMALDSRGKLVSDLDLRSVGLPDSKDRPLNDALDDLADAAEEALRRMDAAVRADDMALEQALARTLKKASQRIWDRRPVVETVVLRV
jgi:ribonuclease J